MTRSDEAHVHTDHDYVSLSEVGFRGPDHKETSENTVGPTRTENGSTNFFGNMEALLSRLLSVTQSTPASHASAKLIKFDPDEADSDIQGWCNVTEIVVESRKLAGPELLLALTHALKGRAAKCLTTLKASDLTWPQIKETLLAKFHRHMLMQDYFDEVLKFQIGSKESAIEAAARLWTLIERIPRVEMNEEVMTGFALSVLSQRDPLIRRESNSHVISTRAQLFRILGGISLKKRHDDNDSNNADLKKPRLMNTLDMSFSGTCNFCGNRGHKIEDCRKRRETLRTGNDAKTSDKERERVCYTCGKAGHFSASCPDGVRKPTSEPAARKDVHICERRSTRGILSTSSDPTYLGNKLIKVKHGASSKPKKSSPVVTPSTSIDALSPCHSIKMSPSHYQMFSPPVENAQSDYTQLNYHDAFRIIPNNSRQPINNIDIQGNLNINVTHNTPNHKVTTRETIAIASFPQKLFHVKDNSEHSFAIEPDSKTKRTNPKPESAAFNSSELLPKREKIETDFEYPQCRPSTSSTSYNPFNSVTSPTSIDLQPERVSMARLPNITHDNMNDTYMTDVFDYYWANANSQERNKILQSIADAENSKTNSVHQNDMAHNFQNSSRNVNENGIIYRYSGHHDHLNASQIGLPFQNQNYPPNVHQNGFPNGDENVNQHIISTQDDDDIPSEELKRMFLGN